MIWGIVLLFSTPVRKVASTTGSFGILRNSVNHQLQMMLKCSLACQELSMLGCLLAINYQLT
jgi:hypothetical protein